MRSSNIEILRILSMAMIIMHHFSVHTGWPDDGGLSSDIAVSVLSFGGKLGVNCFVLITGYFMASGRPKIQSVLRVVLETWFYSYAILCIFLLAQPDLVTPKRLTRALLPLCTGEYWFITCYLGMMLASPFLNTLWRHLSGRGKTYLMALGFIVFSIVPTLTTYDPLGSNLVWFFYLYLLGSWVREQHNVRKADAEQASGTGESTSSRSTERSSLCLFDPLRLVRKLTPMGAFIGCVVFVWASMILIIWAHSRVGFDLVEPNYFILQHTIPTFIASLGLLVAFTRLTVPCMPMVNTVAQTTLGVYLIHDNPLIRAWIWPHVEWIYALGPVAILAFGVLSAIALFAACSFIDWLRITFLEKPLFASINKHWGTRLDKAQKELKAFTKAD